jgi:hypothetical protein
MQITFDGRSAAALMTLVYGLPGARYFLQHGQAEARQRRRSSRNARVLLFCVASGTDWEPMASLAHGHRHGDQGTRRA